MMPIKKLTSVVLGILFLSCTSSLARAGQAGTEAISSQMLIVVGSRGAGVLQGVSVTLFDKEGRSELGVTDGAGQVHIPVQRLKWRTGVLILCRDHYFCGALRLDTPHFFEYGEHYIELAPFAVR
jgi:hypothetical protein